MSDLEVTNQALLQHINDLRSNCNIRTSNATIISILQQNPCLAKCIHDIQNTSYNNSIDPLYSAKHTYVKIKIVDAIRSSFDKLIIKSEHEISSGKIDIAILPDRIILKSQKKIIAIEVKSGKTIDLFQIERYLIESNVLVVVRVPTNDVILIDASILGDVLTKSVTSLDQKVQQILANNLVKVEGEWCYGCTADCEFKKASKWNSNNHMASLDGFEEFMKNVHVVVEKTINILEKELC